MDYKKSEGKIEAMVCIASSFGGVEALVKLLPKIIENGLPVAYLIVQHMSWKFTSALAARLNALSIIEIKEAKDGEKIKAGTAYLAPENFHMEIHNKGDSYFIALNQKPAKNSVRPSADHTMMSVAKKFKGKKIGVVLTGMGRDGTEGSEELKKAKAIIIAQDKESSIMYGMPKEIADRGLADKILPLESIAQAIISEIKRLCYKKTDKS